MRKKIATALVCLALCLMTNTTSTSFAHNHQEVISEVKDTNEMMIEEDSIQKVKVDSIDTLKNANQQQKSNQTYVVRRVTYYYPTGHKTATGHSAKGNEKIISLSPDLLKKFPYHTKVYLEGYGVYTVEDRTASWVKSTADILVPRGTKIKNGRNVIMKKVS